MAIAEVDTSTKGRRNTPSGSMSAPTTVECVHYQKAARQALLALCALLEIKRNNHDRFPDYVDFATQAPEFRRFTGGQPSVTATGVAIGLLHPQRNRPERRSKFT